jgi:hypothetical protein
MVGQPLGQIATLGIKTTMKFALLFTFSCLVIATANAEPISTSVSCTVAGQTTVVSSSACGGTLPDGTAYSAIASASYATSGNTLTFDLSAKAGSVPGSSPITGSLFPVSAMASLNLDVYSNQYSGKAYVVFNGNVRPGGTYGVNEGSILQLTPGFETFCASFSCSTASPTCTIFEQISTGCNPEQPEFIPLADGNTLNVNANVSVQPIYTEYGTEELNGTLSFFEADGVTPLEITSAPEPGGIAFACLGLTMCSVGAFKRRILSLR